MVRVWIQTLLSDKFLLDFDENEEVLFVKKRIEEYLVKSYGHSISSHQILVYKGNQLNDNLKFTDTHIQEQDLCLFIYNLLHSKDQKEVTTTTSAQPRVSTPPTTESPESILNIIHQALSIGFSDDVDEEEDDEELDGDDELDEEGDEDDYLDEEGDEDDDVDDDEDGDGVVPEMEELIANVVNYWYQGSQSQQPQQPQQPQQSQQPLPPQPTQPQPIPQLPEQNPQPQQTQQQQSIPQPDPPQLIPGADQRIPDFPFPAHDLNMLMAMGFPEWWCRKALILNFFNVDLALEWILQHSGDPDIDAPLSPIHIRQIIGDLQNFDQTAEDDSKRIKTQIGQCIKNNKCTFTVTHTEYAPQKWYYCYTCGLVDSEGVCETCAVICHKNHQLSTVKSSDRFYCDCGAGAYNCKCNQ